MNTNLPKICVGFKNKFILRNVSILASERHLDSAYVWIGRDRTVTSHRQLVRDMGWDSNLLTTRPKGGTGTVDSIRITHPVMVPPPPADPQVSRGKRSTWLHMYHNGLLSKLSTIDSTSTLGQFCSALRFCIALSCFIDATDLFINVNICFWGSNLLAIEQVIGFCHSDTPHTKWWCLYKLLRENHYNVLPLLNVSDYAQCISVQMLMEIWDMMHQCHLENTVQVLHKQNSSSVHGIS